MTEDRWEIAWSHQVEGRVGALSCLGEDCLIAAVVSSIVLTVTPFKPQASATLA